MDFSETISRPMKKLYLSAISEQKGRDSVVDAEGGMEEA